MIPSTPIKSSLDYQAVVANSWSISETTFDVETNAVLFSDGPSLRGLQAKNLTSCLDEAGELNRRCRRALLVQPILIGLFFVAMIYCCWKKSTNDISDSYWCCCRKRRLKRQQQQEMSSMQAASSRATIMQGQMRIADSTPDEQEQRENQQRQLRVMATQRRRERELHQIQLENNARLEKIKERIEEEAQIRRALLLSKFQKDGLEKTLVRDNFITNLGESDMVLASDGTIDSKKNGTEEGNASSSVEKTDEEEQLHCSEEQGLENDKQEQSTSYLRVRFDRNDGDYPQMQHLTGKSSVSTFPNECAICLQEYRPNEVIVVSDNPSCVHCYHRDCIVEYLVPLLENDENHTESRSDGRDIGGDGPSPSLPSTTHSQNGRGLPCPCCRQPFLVNPPRIDEEIS